MAKLSIAPERLVERHPRLIVASISGFGQYGPWSVQAACDTSIQALSGIMASTGFPDGPATRVGTSLSDIIAGVLGYCGIVTALAARERTGRGTTVDVAMLDSTFALLEHGLMDALGQHERPNRIGNRHPFMYPFDTFEAKDQPLVICVGNNHLWAALSALGHPEWVSDPQYVDNLNRADNWADGVVLNVDDTRRLPQIIERGMVKVVDGKEVPVSPMKFGTWNSYGAQHGEAIRAEFA